MTRVPQVDFTSLNFADLHTYIMSSPSFVYHNPQYPVLKVVAESTAGGRILPITSPHQNATWLLKFPGPALSCESIDNSSILYENITNNILVAMLTEQGLFKYSFGYISWVPEVPPNSTDISFLPFPGMSSNTNKASYEPPSQGVGPLAARTEPLTLLVAALPGMCSGVEVDCGFALDQVANMTITRCMMYNTPYMANFEYIDNIQSIELTTQGSFNNITGQRDIEGAFALIYTEESDGPTVYKAPVIENFAYQATMDAFGRMFVGTIAYDFWQQKQIIDTQMALTPLLDTKDFNFLRPLSEEDALLSHVNDESTHTFIWNGLSVEQVPNSTIPVADMIEELFRNATISLIGNPLL